MQKLSAEEKAERQAEFEKLSKWFKEKNENVEKCLDEVVESLKKHFGGRPGRPHDKDAIDHLGISDVMGDLLFKFEYDGWFDHGCGLLGYVSDRYFSKVVVKYRPDAYFIYGYLAENGYDEDKPFVFNDLDNRAFVLLTGNDTKAFCLESQSRRYLYTLQRLSGNYEVGFRCCRYWDKWDEEDDWNQEDVEKLLKKGMPAFLGQLEYLKEYSDNYVGETFIRRPDLQWFKDKGFKDVMDSGTNHGYGDCRDGFHVFSLGLNDHLENQTLANINVIPDALFSLGSTKSAIENGDGES